MSPSVATPAARPARLQSPTAWLLGLGLLCSLPLVSIYCCDLWFRSDYRFFPLLIIVPVVLPFWRGRAQSMVEAATGRPDKDTARPVKDIPRRPISLGLWLASGMSTTGAALLFSPWLAVLAVTLAWCAWTLERMCQIAWPRLLKWMLPSLVLLLLPLSERSDPLPSFSSSVTYASSSLLDLLGIAHLPTEQTLQLQSGRYDVAALCRGLGNPYLLFVLAVLLCMSTRCSLSLGLLTIGSVPLWSWGGSVLLATFSAWLAETQDFSSWLGARLWIAQAVALIAEFVSLLSLKRALHLLLKPFREFSIDISRIHEFYNRCASWPEAEPLRKRHSRRRIPSSKPDVSSGDVVGHRLYELFAVAGLFLIGGGVTVTRLATHEYVDQPATIELVTHASATRAWVEQHLPKDALPDELLGMRLIGFEQFTTPGTGAGVPLTTRWTYSDGMRTVALLVSAPYRGSPALVRQALLDGGRIVEPLHTFDLELTAADHPQQDASDADRSADQAGHTIRVEELTFSDSLMGPSYLIATNWAIDGSREDVASVSNNSIWDQMISSIRYQPTSASLILWLDGETPDTDEAKRQLQRMLGRAAVMVRRIVTVSHNAGIAVRGGRWWVPRRKRT